MLHPTKKHPKTFKKGIQRLNMEQNLLCYLHLFPHHLLTCLSFPLLFLGATLDTVTAITV